MSKWVRMRTTIAGPGICAHSGDVIEVSDDFAAAMIASGNAVIEIVQSAPRVHPPDEAVSEPEEAEIVEPTEDATIEPQESAILPRRGNGRRKK